MLIIDTCLVKVSQEDIINGILSIPAKVSVIDGMVLRASDGEVVPQIADSIKAVTIPSNVLYIGEGAFAHCSNLEEIVFSQGKCRLDIGDYAFQGDVHLESIQLPSSVKSIGKAAFGDCSALKSVDMQGVQVIHANAFQNDANLANIEIADNVNIHPLAFVNCDQLEQSKLAEDYVNSLDRE